MTKSKEEQRVELAANARGLVETEAEFKRLQGEERDRRKREKDRHKAALLKVTNFRRKVVDPVGAKVRRAHAAMSELVAQHVERKLVSAEGGARARIATLARTIGKQRVTIDRCKLDIKLAKKKGKAPSEQFTKDLDKAGLELAENLDRLEHEQRAWEVAREELDEAITEVLSEGAE